MFELFSPDAMSRLSNRQVEAERRRPRDVARRSFRMDASGRVGRRRSTRTIDPLHRNLQRRYTNLLIAFSLAPSFIINALGYPGDTPSLARYELRRLQGRIAAALHDRRLDVPTRAHLEDVQSRVAHALDPSAVRGA